MKNLLQVISQFVSLNEEEIAQMSSLITYTTFAKNETLREVNRVEEHIYFVESGLLCGMFNQNRREVINWFCDQNEFITSLNSFNTQTPSFEKVVALEESRVYRIHYDDLHKLFAIYPVFERLARVLTQRYYVSLEERSLALQCLTAKERYEELVRLKPKLVQRISLGQIASYLGISQETLSRVRSK